MNTFGEALKVTVFGQSHAPAVGCVLEGLPAGMAIDREALAAFMARRAPGSSPTSTRRKEADEVTIIAGLNPKGETSGAPIALTIPNGDTHSGDYAAMGKVPRPGHADLVAWRRWGDAWDRAGGGQFSGRLTAPLCAAGALCLQWLERQGIAIAAHALAIGAIGDEPFRARTLDERSRRRLSAQIESLRDGRSFPTIDEARGWVMEKAIQEAASEGDSLGGVIEIVATGVPRDLGDPMFDGVENVLARALFAIPAVKGVDFGAGFGAASLKGSEDNDPYAIDDDGEVSIAKNDAGGILGGITTGAPLLARIALKPTSSIAKRQRSVDLETMRAIELRVKGRHDPCVVPRAVPVAEALFALAIGDLMLSKRAFERL